MLIFLNYLESFKLQEFESSPEFTTGNFLYFYKKMVLQKQQIYFYFLDFEDDEEEEDDDFIQFSETKKVSFQLEPEYIPDETMIDQLMINQLNINE